ncbi:MAG TPA: isoprenylcysteine carboxylmethyltransferase family protein [Candidatus Binataceae bacterium]|jgi:methyltransferase|nr:isoprenylcysteine carboxylmethyltransferase family protein [Candidatus Binataceae bacterium]
MVISLTAYLALLGALGAERIIELIISARHARWAFAHGATEVGAGHYPAMAAFHTSFILSCAGEAIILGRTFPAILGWIALGGALIAQALRYWAIATLGRHWNTRIIVLPEIAPVASGPYRFMRHPNYLAVVIEMICVPMIYGCWITAIVFSAGNAILLRVRIKAEESALGAPYQETFTSVPRLIPRLRH